MTYDRVSLHSAADKLGIEAWVDGVPVMREGGYAYAQYHGFYMDKEKPEIARGLRKLLSPNDGDIVIVGAAEEFERAEDGALAAAFALL